MFWNVCKIFRIFFFVCRDFRFFSILNFWVLKSRQKILTFFLFQICCILYTFQLILRKKKLEKQNSGKNFQIFFTLIIICFLSYYIFLIIFWNVCKQKSNLLIFFYICFRYFSEKDKKWLKNMEKNFRLFFSIFSPRWWKMLLINTATNVLSGGKCLIWRNL